MTPEEKLERKQVRRNFFPLYEVALNIHRERYSSSATSSKRASCPRIPPLSKLR